jgi:hypothetical protein
MGNPLANRADQSLENECCVISAFIALDGSSNVIGYKPTTSPPTAAGPYTRGVGLQRAIGQAGSVATQPHTATGTYTFTLDEPWLGGIEAWVQQTDPGAVASLGAYVDANVSGSTSGGANPGCNPALAVQTIRVRFRNSSTGALTDPAANTGFWLGIKLKRGGGIF